MNLQGVYWSCFLQKIISEPIYEFLRFGIYSSIWLSKRIAVTNLAPLEFSLSLTLRIKIVVLLD